MADYLLAVSANLPETDTQREPTARRNTVQRRTLWTLLIAGAVILITVMAYEGREFRLSEQPAATFSKRYAIRPWVSGKSKLAQSGAQKTGAIGSAASEQPVGLSESHTVPTFGSFSLLIRARENAWVSINADGKRVMQDTLVATTEISVKAHDQIVIRAGNIGALDFFFNGQKLPTQGDYDEAKTVNVNKNGLQPPVPRTSFPVAPASLQQ